MCGAHESFALQENLVPKLALEVIPANPLRWSLLPNLAASPLSISEEKFPDRTAVPYSLLKLSFWSQGSAEIIMLEMPGQCRDFTKCMQVLSWERLFINFVIMDFPGKACPLQGGQRQAELIISLLPRLYLWLWNRYRWNAYRMFVRLIQFSRGLATKVPVLKCSPTLQAAFFTEREEEPFFRQHPRIASCMSKTSLQDLSDQCRHLGQERMG